MKAEMQALVGDVPGALATANDAGALTEKPNPMMAALVTGMSFDNAKKPPSQAEMAERLKQVQKLMPPLASGPKAHALAVVASTLASLGNVADAFKAEAGLEDEPRDVLAPRRDFALAAIFTEQKRIGDFEAALATALRMDEPLERLRWLQSLAAVPATQ